jgi:hypothetical protein
VEETKALNSFAERGYLSPTIDDFRVTQKATYKEVFEEVEAASDIAQVTLMGACVDLNEPHMVAAIVFLQRTIRSCQAALILCERGLVVDAQTLLRSAVEAMFHGIALINDPSVFTRIAREGDIVEAKQADAMIKSLSENGLTEQNIVDLTEVVSRGAGKGAGFSTYDAARVAGLMPLYDTFYRGLSGIASHATFRSMDSSIFVGDESAALMAGPTDLHLEFTLGLLKVCLEISNTKLRESCIFN